MTKNKREPFAYFEFMKQHTVEPILFEHPKQVIIAEQLEDVLLAMRQVEAALKAGYYAAGYVSYEAAPAFNKQYKVVETERQKPFVWFGVFEKKEQMNEVEDSTQPYSCSQWEIDLTRDDYAKKFMHIQRSIAAGETNQVNYTVRMRAPFQGNALAFYRELTKAQSAHYTCFIETEEQQILSASPEMFFRVKNGTIMTRPMAGTARRGKSREEDRYQLEALKQSDKNKLENKMIVDLLCKDLKSISDPGTVEITSLYDIEKYPTVFQMTSTVTAKLRADKSMTDVFKALFPPASMTGDPKERTMAIISEIEDSPRGVYSGAIGYMTPDGEAIFNVPIRTVVIDKDTGIAEYGVGGGITINSTADDEYDEILTKAAVLTRSQTTFQLLESLRLENGTYFLLREHLERLQQSSAYFHFKFEIDDVKKALSTYAKKHSKGIQKVRLLVSQTGDIHVEGQQIKDIEESKQIAVASSPIHKDNIFLYHKTTNRAVYEEHQVSGVYDTLLWNEAGELTEFTNGNLVVEWGGVRYTPPVECGLLPGTFRSSLLKEKEIKEKVIHKEDLERCSRMWLINSVRKWVPVYIKS